MIAVIQRVKNSSVSINGEIHGECGEGLMILLGVANGDTEEDARLLATKICNLRIFTDEGKRVRISYLLDIEQILLRDLCHSQCVLYHF